MLARLAEGRWGEDAAAESEIQREIVSQNVANSAYRETPGAIRRIQAVQSGDSRRLAHGVVDDPDR